MLEDLKNMFVLKTIFKGKTAFYKDMSNNLGQRSFWADNLKVAKIFKGKEDFYWTKNALEKNEKYKVEVINLYDELLSQYSDNSYCNYYK